MALFGKKKKTEEVEAMEPAIAEKQAAAPKLAAPKHVASVIVKPRITEKAAVLTEKNVYTFEVRKGATKQEVSDAVRKLYNVTPTKVNIVNRTPRTYISRMQNRRALESGLRKAYVHLKKGDRIELV